MACTDLLKIKGVYDVIQKTYMIEITLGTTTISTDCESCRQIEMALYDARVCRPYSLEMAEKAKAKDLDGQFSA